MLPTKQIELISKLLKIDQAKFKEAVEAKEEKEVEIADGLTVYDKTELETRDKNLKKISYDEGKQAGTEILVKDLKEKHGLDFPGKDPETFVTELQKKVLADAKIEPTKQLQEKETIITNLRTNLSNLEKEKAEALAKVKEVSLKTTLLTNIPKINNGLDHDEFLLSMQSKGYQFEQGENNKVVVKKDGQVLRNNLQEEVDAKTAMESYAKERNWLADAEAEKIAGRGGGNGKPAPSKFSTYSQAKKHLEEEGINEQSAEFSEKIQKFAKDNADFDYNA